VLSLLQTYCCSHQYGWYELRRRLQTSIGQNRRWPGTVRFAAKSACRRSWWFFVYDIAVHNNCVSISCSLLGVHVRILMPSGSTFSSFSFSVMLSGLLLSTMTSVCLSVDDCGLRSLFNKRSLRLSNVERMCFVEIQFLSSFPEYISRNFTKLLSGIISHNCIRACPVEVMFRVLNIAT
jgi:hypothetical protein